MPDGGSLPGLVIALVAVLVTAYQARSGSKTADRSGFRDDFTVLVRELKEQNQELDDRLEAATVKLDVASAELHAMGRYTRFVIAAAADVGATIPAYTPPPDLSKYLV